MPKLHPFEMAICGYSGSGKTTLISKLVKLWSSTLNIAYIKSDAHHMDMDQEGKDTDVIRRSGAAAVCIQDQEHLAWIGEREDVLSLKKRLCTYDVAMFEGFKYEHLPKIVCVDADQNILEADIDWDEVLALVSEDPIQYKDLPWFQRDDLEGISKCVMSYWHDIQEKIPLYGLVLAGGQSSRMGQNKAHLSYGSELQWKRAVMALESVCDDVYMSVRELSDRYEPYVCIEDQFLNMGPMGGILSAMKAKPDAAWLVMACDLPFVDAEVLQYLDECRNPFHVATCFASTHHVGFPEPLCTIYEPKAYGLMMSFLGLGKTCPRKFLLNHAVTQVEQKEACWLDNINTFEEYCGAKRSF